MILKDRQNPGSEIIKIYDFGIAKLTVITNTHFKTETNAFMGTPAYMSPEQCRSATFVTEKSDVYALGIMMYEMLAGHPPFQGAGHGEVILKHMTEPPVPPPGAPSNVAAFILQLLAKDPARRPSMSETAEAISAMGADTTVMLVSTSFPILSHRNEPQTPPPQPNPQIPSTVGGSAGEVHRAGATLTRRDENGKASGAVGCYNLSIPELADGVTGRIQYRYSNRLSRCPTFNTSIAPGVHAELAVNPLAGLTVSMLRGLGIAGCTREEVMVPSLGAMDSTFL